MINASVTRIDSGAVMTIDPVAQTLHHKACLGGVLTPEEKERLEQWYALNDQEEAAMFAKARKSQPVEDVDVLRNQAVEIVAQMIEIAKKIQTQEAENEKLRLENKSLERKLSQLQSPQPA